MPMLSIYAFYFLSSSEVRSALSIYAVYLSGAFYSWLCDGGGFLVSWSAPCDQSLCMLLLRLCQDLSLCVHPLERGDHASRSLFS